jgi:hypothetical protein
MTRLRAERAAGIALLVFAACGGQAADRPPRGGSDGGQGGSLQAGGSAGTPSGAGAGNGAGGQASAGTAPGDSGGQPNTGGAGVGDGGANDGGAAAAAGDGGAGGAPSCEEPGQCEPELGLSLDQKSCPTSALTLETSATYFIGGVNRWVLQFDWSCSVIGALGEPSRGSLQLRLEDPLSPPLDENERVLSNPLAGAEPPQYVLQDLVIAVRGSGVPEIESSLTLLQSVLRIRREGDSLIGSVHFVGTTPAGARATLFGSFDVTAVAP